MIDNVNVITNSSKGFAIIFVGDGNSADEDHETQQFAENSSAAQAVLEEEANNDARGLCRLTASLFAFSLHKPSALNSCVKRLLARVAWRLRHRR